MSRAKSRIRGISAGTVTSTDRTAIWPARLRFSFVLSLVTLLELAPSRSTSRPSLYFATVAIYPAMDQRFQRRVQMADRLSRKDAANKPLSRTRTCGKSMLISPSAVWTDFGRVPLREPRRCARTAGDYATSLYLSPGTRPAPRRTCAYRLR